MRGGSEHGSGGSLAIGIGFMIVGIGMAITSSIRYHKTVQQIDTDQFEPAGTMVTILGVVAAPFGMILVGYLMCPARTFKQAAVNCRVLRSRPSFLHWTGPGRDRLTQRNHQVERCRLKTSDRTLGVRARAGGYADPTGNKSQELFPPS